MALFESYERRIDQINSVLNSYGIASIEEAEKITKDAGLDVYEQVKKIQPIFSRMHVGHIQSVLQFLSRRVAVRLPMQLQQSVKVFRLSVSRVLLQTIVRLVLAMVILARCCLKKKQNASVSWQVMNPLQLQKVPSVSQRKQTKFVRNRFVLS